jgi:hypothetical protein
MNEYLLHHERKKTHETHTLVSMKNNHGVKESELFMTKMRGASEVSCNVVTSVFTI